MNPVKVFGVAIGFAGVVIMIGYEALTGLGISIYD